MARKRTGALLILAVLALAAVASCTHRRGLRAILPDDGNITARPGELDAGARDGGG